MPVFPLNEFIENLVSIGINCKKGDIFSDVLVKHRPYYERWLLHRDGFLTVTGGNVDYIGIEEVVRMGAFYNVYFLIKNDYLVDTDDNFHRLLDTEPYFSLHKGKAADFGWSGGVLADILNNDRTILEFFRENLMREEIRKIHIRVSNYACVIETRAWEPDALTQIYFAVDKIAYDIRNLISQIHLGDDIKV